MPYFTLCTAEEFEQKLKVKEELYKAHNCKLFGQYSNVEHDAMLQIAELMPPKMEQGCHYLVDAKAEYDKVCAQLGYNLAKS
jgi:hypothetical protein